MDQITAVLEWANERRVSVAFVPDEYGDLRVEIRAGARPGVINMPRVRKRGEEYEAYAKEVATSLGKTMAIRNRTAGAA